MPATPHRGREEGRIVNAVRPSSFCEAGIGRGVSPGPWPRYVDSIKVLRTQLDKVSPLCEAALRSIWTSSVLRRREIVFFRSSVFFTGGLPGRLRIIWLLVVFGRVRQARLLPVSEAEGRAFGRFHSTMNGFSYPGWLW